MRILGIDPGFATVGIGIIDAVSAQSMQSVEWLTITTLPHQLLEDRLLEIKNDLTALIKEYKPEMAVLEKIFFTVNEKTVIDVAQARGVIAVTLAEHAIPTLHITPLQLKQAVTGDGRADKTQVTTMVMRILGLESAPTPDDAADALALAIYGGIIGNAPGYRI